MSLSSENLLLEVKDLSIQFGGLKAVDSLNFSVQKGQLKGLIGPNGAGKTTVFNMLTGVYQPSRGEICFRGQIINRLKPHERCRRGMARTFQNIRLFRELTVLDNVLLGSHQKLTYGIFDSLFFTKKFHTEQKQNLDKALHLLNLFDLANKSELRAAGLPYGQQRKLEIVRALAGEPRLLLLDEPAAGMNHSETDQLMTLIGRVRKEFDLTILLIEHDMKLVMGICEDILVLDHGVKLEEGDSQKVRTSAKVIEAYLGIENEH